MGIDTPTTSLQLLRNVAARIASDSVVWACGRTEWGPTREDGTKRATKKCDRVWECPCCNVPGLLTRRADIRWRLHAAREIKSEVLFVTLKVSHQLGDALDETVRILEYAYDHLLNSGSRGNALRKALGIWLIDKTVQVSVGDQGFHPHYHLLIFFRPKQTPADLPAIERTLELAWLEAIAAAQRLGMRSAQPERPVDVQAVTDADGLAYYLTMPPVTPGGPTGPFVALVRLAEHGGGHCRCMACRRWFSRWREYTAVMVCRKRYSARGIDKELIAAGASPKPATGKRSAR